MRGLGQLQRRTVHLQEEAQAEADAMAAANGSGSDNTVLIAAIAAAFGGVAFIAPIAIACYFCKSKADKTDDVPPEQELPDMTKPTLSVRCFPRKSQCNRCRHERKCWMNGDSTGESKVYPSVSASEEAVH